MTATPADAPSTTAGWAAFRHRDFALYCGSRFLSALAIQMQNVAVGWLVYDLTSDPLALGLVGLAGFLPAILLALVTGHVADRFDRRAVLMVCYAVATASAAGLFLHAWGGSTAVWPIYAPGVRFYGTARAFANPAGQALLPNLVPADPFPERGGLELLGLADRAPSSARRWAASCSPSAAPWCSAPPPWPSRSPHLLVAAIAHRGGSNRREKASWASLIAGILFIRSRPAILGAISLDLFAVLLGGATALLPIYARDILLVGPWGLGLLRSMPAAGAVLMALLLAYRPLDRRSGRRMFQAVAVFGLATIGFGLSTSLYLSMFFLVVLGAADMVSVFVRRTLVQIDTPTRCAAASPPSTPCSSAPPTSWASSSPACSPPWSAPSRPWCWAAWAR